MEMKIDPDWLLRMAEKEANKIVSVGGLVTRQEKEVNKNCLSYWFPRLLDGGVRVPKTEIVKTNCDLTAILDGELPPKYELFLAEMIEACRDISECGPWFLRTGQGSGKHQWKDTCLLKSTDDLPKHIAALVEWSHMVDMLGLPHDAWVIREMLPVEPVGIAERYGGMPIVREMRCFIRDGEVTCEHPYWPEGSVLQGVRELCSGLTDAPGGDKRSAARAMDIYNQLCQVNRDEYLPLAAQVAKLFAGDGAWSVDLLATKNGWYVTDMAEAARSFHWEGCPKADSFKQ